MFRRVVLHLTDRRRRLFDPEDVYYLEADGDATVVRTRSRTTLRDVRPLGDLFTKLEGFGFARIHRSWAVNLDRVREIRPRAEGDDWEVVLESPVRRVLPVSRQRLDHFLQLLEDTI